MHCKAFLEIISDQTRHDQSSQEASGHCGENSLQGGGSLYITTVSCVLHKSVLY